MQLLHGQISHDDAVHDPLGSKVLAQPLRRILVPCGTRNLVKMLPHGKMQMCINDLHIDLFSMQYLFMLSV